MLYLILGSVTFLFSIISSFSGTKEKYVKYLNLTFLMLFFIWGFEYYNTVDYKVMLLKYNQVIYGQIQYENSGEETYIELGCRLLFYLCSPFGNLFYYIIVALFEAFVLRLFCKKYIPVRWWWLFIMLILFQFEYATVLMTLKRQMLAIFTSLLMIYILNEKESVWPRWKTIFVALCLCFLAFNFHKSAIVTILFIPLWMLTKYNYCNKWILLGITCFYIFQYFFDLSAYSALFFNLIESQDEKYAHYALQIENGGRDTSVIHTFIEFVTFLLILFSLRYCTKRERIFALAGLFHLLLVNFFVMDSGRILLPFTVCQLFAIPIAISKLNHINRFLSSIIAAMFIVISVKSTYQVYTNPDRTSMTEGFKSFNLIFEAPSFQVNNPQSESKKYLPYR